MSDTPGCDTSTLKPLAARLGGSGAGSPRVRLGVDLGGRGRGRRGGVFPKTTLDFLDSLQTRPDPTRPRPRSPTFISYPSTRPPPTRPHSHTGERDAPCWALFISGAFSHCQFYWEYWEVQNCRYPNPMMLSACVRCSNQTPNAGLTEEQPQELK